MYISTEDYKPVFSIDQFWYLWHQFSWLVESSDEIFWLIALSTESAYFRISFGKLIAVIIIFFWNIYCEVFRKP